MLSEPTIGLNRRSLVIGRSLGGRFGLRVSVAVIAVLYVVGPTVLQWITLDGQGGAARGEMAAVEIDRSAETVMADRRAASRQLAELLSPQVPERWRGHVPAVLEALAGRSRDVRLGLATVLDSAVRAVGLAVAAGVAVLVGAKLTWRPNRPKHARREGWTRILG